MPRTKKIKTIEERIGEAREEVFRAKDRYDAAVKKLNELLEKKREMEGKELLEAFAQTKKPLSMILEFMQEGNGEGDGVKDSESEKDEG